MREPFKKDYLILCFVVDKTIMTGQCNYDDAVKEFGEKLIKDFMYNKKIIRRSNRNTNYLELTEEGKNKMK
jgi:hypothetical protein